MLIQRITTVGSYELIYNVFVSLFQQLPTVFLLISTLPVLVQELLILAVMAFGSGAIAAIVSAAKRFIVWLNSKL